MKTPPLTKLALAALALGATLGCLSAAAANPPAGAAHTAPGVTNSLPGFTNTASAAREELDNYRMVKMDSLVFKIDQDPLPADRRESVAPLMVNSRGDLEVPVSRWGDAKVVVKAQGRTVLEVKKEIKELLEAQYYKTAAITLYLQSPSAKPGTVLFYGEIKGPYPLPPGQPKYLSEVILEMKPSDFANLKKVELLRMDPVTKKVTTRKINVDEILGKGLKEKDPILQDGDIIKIFPKMFNF